MKKILLPILLLLFAVLAQAQPSTTASKIAHGTSTSVAAGQACSAGAIYLRTDTGHQFLCPAGTWVDFGTGGATGATVALDNLAAVNINASLLAQTGVDLGSTTKPFRNAFIFGAGTYGTTYFELTGTPTSTRVVTLPDLASYTLAQITGGQTFAGTQAFSGTVTHSGVITQTSASATAFESGPNGSTNPVLRLVNSTASQADGISINGGAAGAGTTIQALSSGSNSPINILGKGTGAVFVPASSGGVTVGAGLQFSGLTNTGIGADAGNFAFWLANALKLDLTATEFRIPSNQIFSFSSATNNLSSSDTGIGRPAAGVVEINNGTAGSGGDLLLRGANGTHGEGRTYTSASTTITAATGTTITATNLIPAGSIVLAVVTRVTTAFGTANGLTSLNIGDGTTANLFSNNSGITVNTTTTLADHLSTFTPKLYKTATSVVVTAVGGTGYQNGVGVIRITVLYYSSTAPTS